MLEKMRAEVAGVARDLQRMRISRREAELLESFRRMEARDQEAMLRFGAALGGQQMPGGPPA